MAKVRNVQFYRNSNLPPAFESFANARNAAEVAFADNKSVMKDGELMLYRYLLAAESEMNPRPVHTIVGVVRNDGTNISVETLANYDETQAYVTAQLATLNAIADADTASGTGYATVTTTTPTADFKVLNAVQEVQGVLTQGVAYQLKKVAATAESEDLLKTSNSAAVYDIAATEISNTWVQTVQGNILADGDNVDADLNKLDNKIAGLADELIRDEQVINATVSTLQNSIGLQGDLTLDLSDDQSGIIANDTSVKDALLDLATAVDSAGNVNDVQINSTSIVDANKEANIAVDGNYDATNNKIATESTVSGAINALDVNEYEQAEIDTTTSQTETTLKIKSIKEVDGKIAVGTTTPTTDIKIDGTYNASTNKIATESTVEDAIEALDSVADADDTTAQTGHATITTTTPSADFKVLNSVTEQDGKLTAADAYLLKKLAATGAAEDVSIADSEGHTAQTTVEGAIDEIYDRIEAIEGSFDVIKSTNAATTPAGVTWTDTSTQPATTVTGTLVADATTFHKVYLVPVDNTGTNKYAEYITTKQTSGEPAVTTYDWERLGTIDVDLTGYVKSVTTNGVQHNVDTSSTNISLGTIVNAITGETAISGGESGLVAVTPTDTVTDGVRTTDLDTTVKIEEVADGLTKDQNPSYTTGHYVIVNGKLVDASTASTGDTYTKSANDGLTKASDVKAYIDTHHPVVANGDGIEITSTTTNNVTTYTAAVDLAQHSTVEDTTTPSSTVPNLLIIDSNHELSISDTWDCGTY